MKIVSGETMGRIDARAMDEYGIPGVILMENAALQAVRRVRELCPEPGERRIVILCGRGNNGGDGFVMARHLTRRGYRVSTWAAGEIEEYRGDAAVNYQILQRTGVHVRNLAVDDPGHLLSQLGPEDLVVDALLGTGLSRQVGPPFDRLIAYINQSPARVLAVDIPSGISADTGEIMGVAVEADCTVTFALPKRGLLLFPGAAYAGEVAVVDIGIPGELIDSEMIQENLVTTEFVGQSLPSRELDGHKGTYGRVLILAGSPGMTGAAALTGEAALRGGAGLVYAGTAAELRPVLESKLKEVISLGFPGDGQGCLLPDGADEILEHALACQALAFGPGLKPGEKTWKLLGQLLARLAAPMIIDAGGLGALARDTSILKEKNHPLVLTPHPGEMSRLTGKDIEEVQRSRWELAQEYADLWGVVVVLKGAHTVTALPQGQLYVNPTGNPLLSTAGTGDVLTGLIAALAARGLSPEQAAVCGVFLHGLAADLLAVGDTPRGAMAGELSPYIPQAWSQVLEVLSRSRETDYLFIRPYSHLASY